MKNKDGYVWLLVKKGTVTISTVIPGATTIGDMEKLQERLNKAGFENDDRVRLEFKPEGSVEMHIDLDDLHMTVLQANLCLKTFVACLKDSGVIKNPLISRIHSRLAQTCTH